MNTFELRDNLRYYNQRFSEMPVGDPMSGVCYGEYLKSKVIGAIIGVVAAIATVGAAAPIIAAAWAGTASIGAGIAAGAMAAGGVMTGVGAVTGNKKLMKIGGVLALAGGLGSLVMSNFGSASAVVGETSPVAAQPVAEGALAEASQTLSSNLVEAGGSEAFGATAEGMNSGALNIDTLASGKLGAGLEEASAVASQAGSPVQPGGIVSQALGDTPSAALSQTPNDVAAYTGADYSKGVNVANVQPPNEGGGFLDKATGWMDKNKTLVEMGGKLLSNLGGQALNGGNAPGTSGGAGSTEANDAYLASKTNETNASADALRSKQEAEAQQRKNASTQILMISANDPNRDAKVANAIANNQQYQIMLQPAAVPVTLSGQNYATTSNQWAPQR